MDRVNAGAWGLFGGEAGRCAAIARAPGRARSEFRTFSEAFGTRSPSKFASVVLRRGRHRSHRQRRGWGIRAPARAGARARPRRRPRGLHVARSRACPPRRRDRRARRPFRSAAASLVVSDVRTCRPDELGLFLRTCTAAFGGAIDDDEVARLSPVFDTERLFLACEDDDVVGTAGTLALPSQRAGW